MKRSHRSRVDPVVCETANAVGASTGTSTTDSTTGMLRQSQPMGLVVFPLAITMKCRWQPVE